MGKFESPKLGSIMNRPKRYMYRLSTKKYEIIFLRYQLLVLPAFIPHSAHCILFLLIRIYSVSYKNISVTEIGILSFKQ
jgi:hypothetical protein